LQHQLTDVAAVEQVDQRLREGVQPDDHVFFAFHAAIFQLASHFGNRQVVAGGVVKHHNAFHAGAVDQQAEVVFRALYRRCVVVLADRAADDDAGFAIILPTPPARMTSPIPTGGI